jgi:hemerythrin-like domain-containing protein
MQKLFITAQLFLLVFLLSMAHSIDATYKKELSKPHEKEEFEIPLTEDLMREHGLLNRLLLIYQNCIERIDAHQDIPVESLTQALHIMKSFVEQYHEKMEEDYIFPLFEQHNTELELVTTLKEQHIKGREITNKLIALINSKKGRAKHKKTIRNLLQKFITMYRPHEAREDTVLFPQIRSLLTTAEFDEMGQNFDDLEHTLFGPDGFQRMLGNVATIEKALGIYDLAQFTP